MPRVKLGPSTNELVKVIRKYANEAENGVKECLDETRMTVSRYYRRLKEPEELTVSELRQLSRAFRIPWDEMEGALQRAIGR